MPELRLVGYVRETADRSDPRSAFAQQEELRRHAADSGDLLVAVCQDTRQQGAPTARHGFFSMLGVIASGAADAVLLPGVATLSSDEIVQEILLWDLRTRGVRVISTLEADRAMLDAGGEPDPARMLIRDVLTRVGEYAADVAHLKPEPASPPPADVLVRIIGADHAEVRLATSPAGDAAQFDPAEASH
ncbi:MAG: recombinase family protein [Acidimicrobiia bacterium]|nr:MAG: recombinase family protein [Acidimicrobiia bacterium]